MRGILLLGGIVGVVAAIVAVVRSGGVNLARLGSNIQSQFRLGMVSTGVGVERRRRRAAARAPKKVQAEVQFEGEPVSRGEAIGVSGRPAQPGRGRAPTTRRTTGGKSGRVAPSGNGRKTTTARSQSKRSSETKEGPSRTRRSLS